MFDIYNKDDKFGQVRKPFESTPIINEAEKEDNVEQKIFDFFKDNKNPPDEKIHGLAEKLKVNPHKFEAAIYKILSSFLSNGRFNEKGKGEDSYSKDELEMGIKVEQEHTNNPDMAKRIALDHLAEFPNYYTALLKMEDDLKKANEGVINEDGGNIYDVIGRKGISKESYPELDKISKEIGKIVEKEINNRVKSIKSEMPYKAQYVLEKLISLLRNAV